jgi:hypothetical protein
MSFEIGHSKQGGRQKGTPNKKTLMKADEILTQLNINPIRKLIEIAESEGVTTDQKINCYKEIAKYTFPKLKSQDIRIERDDMPNLITVELVNSIGERTALR